MTQYNTHKQAAFAHLENVPALHASKLSAGELLEYNDDGALISYYTTCTNLFLLHDKFRVRAKF